MCVWLDFVCVCVRVCLCVCTHIHVLCKICVVNELDSDKKSNQQILADYTSDEGILIESMAIVKI